MVIQRKQSLFLLIAAILMGIYAFMPSLMEANGETMLGGYRHGVDMVPFILNCLVAILSFIAIFKYKSLKMQKSICIVNILLIISSIATICCIALMHKDCDLLGSITYYNILPVVAIIFLLLAHKGISHDQRLLSGSSRIR
ncbi:MAG: DUF4293 domain-containing protein [Muribaculaceae bacterium]|nr:DUF4293 domain-containing protein [Muribaculaceae bacterium]MBR6490537.1 DUF4293 domain-containing protein [Muribaculaceae bacterium]